MMAPTSRIDDENDEIIFLGKRPRTQPPSTSPDVEFVGVVSRFSNNYQNNFSSRSPATFDVQDVALNLSTQTPSTSLLSSQSFQTGPTPILDLSSIILGKSLPSPETTSSALSIDSCEDHCSRCSICFEPFGDSDSSHHLVTLKCGHIFGNSCIEKWLKPIDQRKCPTCKKPATTKQLIKIYAEKLPANQSLLTKYQNAIKQLEIYKNEAEKLKKKMNKKSSGKQK